uniref:Uncharacterized protein n=1 Tax=Chromera velia CCMP2878 TaxID=1169474 RepID=A0A0G4I0L6_9ALVE|eukprot:Cvel_9983.t1-p1 / transcript=Cvel_9983.t1 / gene=Cvel_9983 / organism=Chromera_velia_CCMP2878 / gene_product=hypothetical protein / transcript_product=hypothetical protein / location=Cvel_scaffold590:71363-71617(+) / protein_length=85 / sequence_SO=supercontig / SO=protein_coding / is_pseudo=false
MKGWSPRDIQQRVISPFHRFLKEKRVKDLVKGSVHQMLPHFISDLQTIFPLALKKVYMPNKARSGYIPVTDVYEEIVIAAMEKRG